MIRKRKNRHTVSEFFSLDSLIDIISNTLGIVILLTLVSMIMPKNMENELQIKKMEEEKLLAVSHVVNTKYNIFFFSYNNRLIFVDLNEAIYSLLKSVPDDLDGLSVDKPFYKISFESVKLGDIKNHWTNLTLKEKNITHSPQPDLSDLEKFAVISKFPPSETMVIIIAYPSSHQTTCEAIRRFKKLGYPTSLSLHEYTYTYTFGYSHYSTMIKAD